MIFFEGSYVLKKRKSLLINGFGLSEELISETPVKPEAIEHQMKINRYIQMILN